MRYLNLMQNKLKPKEVNDALEKIATLSVPKVVNSLDSTSTTDALSSAQGKVLNDEKVGAWQLVSSGASTSAVNLPTSWKEILIDVEYNGVHITSTHPYNTQGTADSGASFGNYGTSYAIGVISRTSVRVSQVIWGGTNVTTESNLSVYYR